MPTFHDEVDRIRIIWRAQAEDFASRLTKDELETVHRDLVKESNANAHAFADVLIYIDAVRSEYRKRFGDGNTA